MANCTRHAIASAGFWGLASDWRKRERVERVSLLTIFSYSRVSHGTERAESIPIGLVSGMEPVYPGGRKSMLSGPCLYSSEIVERGTYL